MPELPEVETVCRGLNRVTIGHTIRGGDVLLGRTIAHPISIAEFLGGLEGCQIQEWTRRGKYLLAQLAQPSGGAGGWLGVHLRMTGQLLWVNRSHPLPTHARVRLYFQADERELRFIDQRTFGRLWWVPPDLTPEQVISGLATLGPEPLGEAFSAQYLADALGDRHKPIKNALLDQQLVAGIGNIYADEALFLSGIRPKTLCKTIGPRRMQRLYKAIVQVLTTSIQAGGTTFSDFRDIYGINGNYGGVAWVYDREGEPCRVCGTRIQRLKLAGRSAHYCPCCQR